jgi:hypothetical protein
VVLLVWVARTAVLVIRLLLQRVGALLDLVVGELGLEGRLLRDEQAAAAERDRMRRKRCEEARKQREASGGARVSDVEANRSPYRDEEWIIEQLKKTGFL